MAIVASGAVKIEGMREFLASMRQAEVQTPTRVTRLALNRAAELVVTAARVKAPARTGRLRRSIRASSTGQYARVSEGSASVPYAGFIDYGGTVGRLRYKRVNGVQVHHAALRAGTARRFATRPFIPTGRVLYPAFRDNQAEVVKVMSVSLNEAIESVGLRVTHG